MNSPAVLGAQDGLFSVDLQPLQSSAIIGNLAAQTAEQLKSSSDAAAARLVAEQHQKDLAFDYKGYILTAFQALGISNNDANRYQQNALDILSYVYGASWYKTDTIARTKLVTSIFTSPETSAKNAGLKVKGFPGYNKDSRYDAFYTVYGYIKDHKNTDTFWLKGDASLQLFL